MNAINVFGGIMSAVNKSLLCNLRNRFHRTAAAKKRKRKWNLIIPTTPVNVNEWLTWKTVYATQVNGRCKLKSPILNMSMPHVSMSPNNVPNTFSCGVSTPNVGTRSPVNELVCDSNGRVTPAICDIGGPPKRGERLRCFCAANALLISFSSIRNDGKSNSCCLSVRKKVWKIGKN